ncbi:uncharacterized protein LOC123881577 isoform X1 [Trifolium pratense]|uniref:uncharacterized protein LOC123881577 isoform X1 n=1 Tax=Trifolium pratense TaxID=57577 RepID=UPI001E694768|nr:uncharacterized protein LOC123881577 isoform X1 [Trifolium pratense]
MEEEARQTLSLSAPATHSSPTTISTMETLPAATVISLFFPQFEYSHGSSPVILTKCHWKSVIDLCLATIHDINGDSGSFQKSCIRHHKVQMRVAPKYPSLSIPYGWYIFPSASSVSVIFPLVILVSL